MHCRRPSFLQLLSYFLTALLFPITCLSSLTLIFPVSTACIVLSYVFIYAQNFFLTFYDISPDELIERRKQGIKPMPFNPKIHAHVIEDGFCNICQIKVKEHTKHCRKCDICVEGFDHHCIWLNNCIGKKNYRKFIVLLLSIVILCIGASIYGFLQLYFWVSNTNQMQESAQILPFKFPIWIWLLASFTTFVSHFAIAAVTAHLLHFHVKLWKKGITTYRFIVDQRRKTAAKVSRETISAQNDISDHRWRPRELAVETLRDTSTSRVGDVQQPQPSYLQVHDNYRSQKPHTPDLRPLHNSVEPQITER